MSKQVVWLFLAGMLFPALVRAAGGGDDFGFATSRMDSVVDFVTGPLAYSAFVGGAATMGIAWHQGYGNGWVGKGMGIAGTGLVAAYAPTLAGWIGLHR